MQERCNRLSPGIAVVLGGERFDIECLIGEGGFARVYKSKSEDGNFYAIKVFFSVLLSWKNSKDGDFGLSTLTY